MFASLAIFLVIILTVSLQKLPPEINKCRLSDPKLSDCMKISVKEAFGKLKNGNKELGVIPFDPLVIPKLSFGDLNSEVAGVKQEYENVKIHGISGSTIVDLNIEINEKNCRFSFKTNDTRIIMEGNYSISGRILVFPINGHGKCRNVFDDVEGFYDIKCQTYAKHGKMHARVLDVDIHISPKKMVFDFENIIDGNEQLSKQVLKTVNENAETVFADVSPALDEIVEKLTKDVTSQVFSRLSLDELFLL